MSLTIQYHNPERPAEASMTLITGQPRAAAIIAQLERRGLVVDKITFTAPRRGR
jgi:hypothetical protein